MVLFTNTERGVLSSKNSYEFISTGPNKNNAHFLLSTGVATAGTLNSITLEEGKDDAFNDRIIEVIHESGQSEFNVVETFVSLVATVRYEWINIPTTATKYIIHKNSGVCQDQLIVSNPFILILASDASSIDNFYQNCCVKYIVSPNDEQINKIKYYDGTTKKATLYNQIQSLPDNNTMYVIYGESGTSPNTDDANDSTTIVIQDGIHSVLEDCLHIEIYDGTGLNQIRCIESFIDNVLTIDPAWEVIPDNTSKYMIFAGWGGDLEKVLKHAVITVGTELEIHNGDRVIMEINHVMEDTLKYKNFQLSEYSAQNPLNSHAYTIISQYFILKVINIGLPIDGYLQTIYNSYKSGKTTLQVNEAINENHDCDLTKTIMLGQTNTGKFNKIKATTDGLLSVSLESPIDAFNMLNTAEPEQIIDMTFPYDYINPMTNMTSLANGGTVTSVRNMANISTGTNTSGGAYLRSRRRTRYVPGLGILVRFSAVFGDPIENSIQTAGFGDKHNGVFFGYDGLKFGILRRSGGRSHIVKLTVSAVSDIDTTITITLNSIASSAINILSTDSKQQIARKVANTAGLTLLGTGWVVSEDGDTVLFVSQGGADLSGTYSYTPAGGTSTGSFTTLATGVSPTNNWVYQYNWNIDRADNITELPDLNFQKGNVFTISLQWLGFGMIIFKIENPDTGKIIPVHAIKYANTSLDTSIENPNLPISFYVGKSTAGSSNVVLKTGSASVFITGRHSKLIGPRFGAFSAYATSSGELTAGTAYNILTIRNNPIYQNQVNFSEIYLVYISACLNTPSAISRGGICFFINNGVIDNTTDLTWTPINSNLCTVSTCQNVVPVAGGLHGVSLGINPGNNNIISVVPAEFFLYPNSQTSLCFKPFVTMSVSDVCDIVTSISWIQRS